MLSFTVSDLLEKNLEANASRVALIIKDQSLTYGELANSVDQTAAYLHLAGIVLGDRVGIHLPKSIDEVVATFAVARIGAVFVNINYQWVAHQLEYIVRDCGIRALFTDTRRAGQIAQTPLADAMDRIIVRGAAPRHPKIVAWDEIPDSGILPPNPSIDADLAALLYTSGSTGNPKGVMFSHRNIILGARSVAKYLKNSPEDRILSLLPLSFDYGLNQIMTMFLVGGSVVLQPVSLPAEIAKTVAANQVTGVALVAPSWVQLVRFLEDAPMTFPSLRYITNSGGKIPLRILEAMPRMFTGADIFLMYGLTEAFRSTYLPPDLFLSKMGSIGRAIPNTDIFVVDAKTGLCGPGQQGELIHRGGLISLGYWNNQAATDEKLKVNDHLRAIIGEEKVLHSGDTVRIDDDGCLWFVGRADAMIKCSGFRLSPTEVEEILSSYPDVAEAVAFGVDDEELGQVVHVAVTGHNAAAVNRDALHRFCLENMPKYMVPRKIHVHQNTMPRTVNGKIDRQRVIAECAAQDK
ncbi:MAG: AMP-binding protein [Verrucomicrobia bacterium]|nr:AMP-binding protein [Verrucomicrobiota bacterium]